MSDVQRYTGCNHAIGPGFHMALCNETVKLIDGKKVWYLEWHHYFGPIACTKSGDPLARAPSEKSRFWLLAQLWKDQGCRVIDGVGQWEMPQPVMTREMLRVGRSLFPLDIIDRMNMPIDRIDYAEVVEVWECVGYEQLIPMEIRKKGGDA